MEPTNRDLDSIIAKQLSGNAGADEMAWLEKWMSADPRNRDYFQESQKLWSVSSRLKRTESADINSSWLDLEQRISAQKSKKRPVLTYMQLAAVLIVTIGMIFLVTFFLTDTKDGSQFSKQVAANTDTFTVKSVSPAIVTGHSDSASQVTPVVPLRKSKKGTVKNDAGTMIAVNSEDSAMIFYLPDQTKVYLNKNSKLTFPEKFIAGSRTVYVSGEAFFEVAHDKGEFLVYCQDVRVRVLGTSFNVRGYQPASRVEVTVEEGLVEVKATDKENLQPVLLKKGEQGSYVRGQVAITKGKASKKDKWWKRNGFRSRIKNFFNKIIHSGK